MVRRQVELTLVLTAALAAEWTLLFGPRSPVALTAAVLLAVAVAALVADAARGRRSSDGSRQAVSRHTPRTH